MFIRITCRSYGEPFLLNAALVLTVREATSDGHDRFETPTAAVQIDPRYHDRFEEVAAVLTNELASGEIFTVEPFEEVAAQLGVEILRPVDVAGFRQQVEEAIAARSTEPSSAIWPK